MESENELISFSGRMSAILNFGKLKSFVDQQNPIGALECVEHIVQHFNMRFSIPEMRILIELLLEFTSGSEGFLSTCTHHGTIFIQSQTRILKLWYDLFEMYINEINLQKHTDIITEICCKYLKYTNSLSKYPCLILMLFLRNKMISDTRTSEVLSTVNSLLMKPKPTYEMLPFVALLVRQENGCDSKRTIELIKPVYVQIWACVPDQTSSSAFVYKTHLAALESLVDFLHVVVPSTDDNSPDQFTISNLYRYLRTMCIFPENTKRKDVFRAGIRLYCAHSSLFKDMICRESMYWNDCFNKWLSSHVEEDRRSGADGYFALYGILKSLIMSDLTESREKNDVVYALLNKFVEALESKDSQPELIQISIKGFGIFSGICKTMYPDLLDKLISLIVQQSGLILMADETATKKLLTYFPDYLEALGEVVNQIKLPSVSNNLIEYITNILIRLIRDFQYLPESRTPSIVLSIYKTYVNIYLTDSALLDRLIRKVIFEGVIWTCSHKHVYDTAAAWDDSTNWKDNITFKSYLPLWFKMFETETKCVFHPPIISKISFYITCALFDILKRLNLQTQKRVYSDEDGKIQEFHFCDPYIDLCAVCPKDFHIFINLVDFYKEILTRKNGLIFSPWLETIALHMIISAYENPMVSGFLKLLKTTLVLIKADEKLMAEMTPKLDSALTSSLQYFIEKCQRVSGELQYAMIDLVLSYPSDFYRMYLKKIEPVFSIALSLGSAIPWLAVSAIKCCEMIWHSNPLETVVELNKHILPLLDPYLKGAYNMEGIEAHIRQDTTGLQETELSLKNVQVEIIKYLGLMPPEACSVLVMGSAASVNLVKWNFEKSININLKQLDLNLILQFDSLLPRICELSETTADRKLQIIACEMIHAFIIYLLGTRAHEGFTWKQLIKQALTLGCSGDITLQQMFQPLLMELTHFMSKYENLNKGVEELIDCILEGIATKVNFAMRDLSASCLCEFVDWSIKQTTPEQLAASPVSISIILGQLKLNSFDSDPFKRVGSALAFNNLYRRLREEETLYNMHFIDLLYTFCISYKLTEELTMHLPNKAMESDLKIISEAIDHVVRVLKERNDLFNNEYEHRITPTALKSGTLKDVLTFLVTEASSKKYFYRCKCMSLAEEIAPKVSGLTNLKDFFQSNAINDDNLREICEGSEHGYGIRARPNLNFLTDVLDQFIEVQFYGWLEHFAAALECYVWFLNQGAIQPGRNFFQNTNIMSTTIYYLKYIYSNSLTKIMSKINPKYTAGVSNSIMLDSVYDFYAFVEINIIRFLTALLASEMHLEIVDPIWDPSTNDITYQLIIGLIFYLHAKQYEVEEQLSIVEQFVIQTQTNCPYQSFSDQLNLNIFKMLINNLTKAVVDIKAAKSTKSNIKIPTYITSIKRIIESNNIFVKNLIVQQALKHVSKTCMSLSSDILHTSHPNTYSVRNLETSVKGFVRILITIAFAVEDYSETVFNYVIDNTKLCDIIPQATVSIGWVYFDNYELSIAQCVKIGFFEKSFNVLPSLAADIQSHVLRVITSILDSKRKALRKREEIGNELINVINLCLQNISTVINCMESKSDYQSLVEYFSLLILITKKHNMTFDKSVVGSLRTWIISELSCKTIHLEKKSKIICLLPILIGVDDYEDTEIMATLEELQRNELPLRSKEFCRNSLEETNLKSFFLSLLSVLVSSRSYIILEFLFKCTAADEDHLLENTIAKELREFTINLTKSQQIEVLNRAFTTVLAEEYDPMIRLTILRRFLLNIFINCTERALMSFFERHIKTINKLIEADYRVSSTGGRISEQALVNRIVGYDLIQNFFGTVRKELYWTTDCPIAKELLGQPATDSVLVGTFTKKAFYVRIESFQTENMETNELFRLYQCSAYCALCSLVSNTQNQLKFFSKFLFEENTRKNEIIWQRLIDLGKNYITQDQELEDNVKVKKRFVAIRQLLMPPKVSFKIPSSKRMQTQNIMESSLSQDIRGLDMTSFSVRTYAEALRYHEAKSAEICSVYLETHDINKHEIMPMLCGVINFMYNNNITPVVTDVTVKRSYPWVLAIANNIEAYQPRNVRIFLAQVVNNCSTVFKQFAHIFFKPILKMLVDECAGSKLNFFITDMIILLIGWTSENIHTPQSADEILLIQDLLKFVIKNGHSEKNEILKFNLEIIQTMLNVWTKIIVVPSNLILDMITLSASSNSQANEYGITILGLFLSRGLIPWTAENKILYLNAMLVNIKNNSRVTYETTAYALGTTLKLIKEANEDINVEYLSSHIHSQLQKWNQKRNRGDEKRFVDILFGIYQESPDVFDKYLGSICLKLITFGSQTKRKCLEMILTRIDAIEPEDVYSTIISIGINDLLQQYEHQLLPLHILNRSLPMLTMGQIERHFNWISQAIQLPDRNCRDIGYEMCIYISQNAITDLKLKAMKLLIKAVNDTDVDIQKRIYRFWTREIVMPSNILDRLLFLMKNFAVDADNSFLILCIELILSPTIEDSESKKQLFEFEEDRDSKLHEYEIHTKFKSFYKYTLPPLFSESQLAPKAPFNPSLCTLVENSNEGYMFQPTQDPATESTTDRENFTLPSQPSVFFKIGTQVLNRQSEKVRYQYDNSESQGLRNRRFLKSPTSANNENSIKTRTYQKGYLKQHKKKIDEYSIRLYRRYRTGNYPDLLINKLAFLLPLQGLIRKDMVIAKNVLIMLVTSIVEANTTETKDFLEQLNDIFQLILKNSTTCDPVIFSAIMEICLLRPSVFHLPPKDIARIANITKNLPIAALYLERRLIADWDNDIAELMEPQHWLQLGVIYNSLKEYDIVSSIFTDKLRTDPRLATAIELKSQGKVEKAQELLVKVIRRNDKIEQYYAFNCYYECALELGDWDHVIQAVNHEINNISELWTDDYNKEFLLPKFAQAQIQKLLEGNSENMTFWSSLENWLTNEEKQRYIRDELTEETMMYQIATGSYFDGSCLFEYALRKFMNEWCSTSFVCTKVKLENLMKMQRIFELKMYCATLGETFTAEITKTIAKVWSYDIVDSLDSLRLHNTLLGYRNFMCAKATDALGSHLVCWDSAISSVEINYLREGLTTMAKNLFSVAIKQNNLILAQKICDQNFPSKLNIADDMIILKNTIMQTLRNADISSYVITSWNVIQKIKRSIEMKTYHDEYEAALDLQLEVALLARKKITTENIDETIESTLRNVLKKSSNEVARDLLDSIMDTYMKKISIEDAKCKHDRLSRDFYTIAALTHYELQQVEDSLTKLYFTRIFVGTTLRGLGYCNENCRQYFPCVLQCISEDNQLSELFLEYSKDIALWLYFEWIPQIISYMSLNQPCYLDDIVLTIATKYPEVLRYPFAIWYTEALQRMKQTNYNPNYIDRPIIRKILNALKLHLYQKFIKSVSYISVPEAYLIAQLEHFDKNIRNYANITDEHYKNEFENLLKDVYDEEGLQGVAYRRLLVYKPVLEELKEVSILSCEEKVRKTFTDIVRSLRKHLPTNETTVRLETMSPWLANYQWCGEEYFINIPGQYEMLSNENGIRNLEHNKIVRFQSNACIYISQRYPIRISIHGSNGQRFTFLVKQGEDLKQDQRIQQLLGIMSEQLNRNEHCISNNLRIETYTVIPFVRNCGILKWVPDTISMHDFILNCFHRKNPNSKDIIQKAFIKFRIFIGQYSPFNVNNLVMYGNAASKSSRDKLLQNFRALETYIDMDIIPRALMDIALSTEYYYILRNNFASSLATMNIAHWILGVGDRHLKNLLISVKTGFVTGIDFGFTFGSGTRDQGVPELMPFRLTPHFVNAMAPMGTSGLISKSMVRVLKIFRSEIGVLLASMEVFIREPSINWLDMAKKKLQDNNEVTLRAWEPKDRIAIARCKLEGYNPMQLFERELKSGLIANHNEYLQGYLKILRGHLQFNIRSRLPVRHLTAEQQVECLIDQATDPTILGISYAGFSPWI